MEAIRNRTDWTIQGWHGLYKSRSGGHVWAIIVSRVHRFVEGCDEVQKVAHSVAVLDASWFFFRLSWSAAVDTDQARDE